MESSSTKNMESVTTELQNDVKLQQEIPANENIKIKLEPNEDMPNELSEIIWLDSDLVIKEEFLEKPIDEIVKTKSFDNRKELDAELENESRLSNPRNIKKTVPKSKKSYKCTLCELSFPKKSDLKKHSTSDHAGIKPHKCLSCESSFSEKSGLICHIASVHEGKKPHKCQSCDSSFSKKYNLVLHITSVHEGKKPLMKKHSASDYD